MGYSLGQAAKAAGRAKTTIHRSIVSGRLSATRIEAGGWSIDPAELARVFPVERPGSGAAERTVTGSDTVALLAERDRLVAEQAESIRDLRARLDASEDERRRVQERLTALLTGPRRSWWRRWRR